MIEILYDESTGCKEVVNVDDYQGSRQRKNVNLIVTWLRISFDHLQ